MSDKLEGLTMGCQVEHVPCSICGELPCDHVRISPQMSRNIAGFEFSTFPVDWPSRRIVGASLVSAPKCDSCGNEMAIHSNTDWVCVTGDCQAEGFAVPAHLLGVFPAKLLP